MKLSQLMGERPRPVVGLPSSATTMEAATLMDAEQVESIVVLDNGRRLVGVLSERDLALAIAHRGARLFRSPIGELASVRGTTASPDDGVRAVIRVMTERRARLIPVLDGERIVAVVSLCDLLEARLTETVLESSVLEHLARARLSA